MMNSAAAAAMPRRDEFLELAATHTLVPVFRTLMADLETPVGAFLRLAAPEGDGAETEAFLLESVEGGERVGRHTFIGIEPYQRYTVRGRTITHRTGSGAGARVREFEGDIFAERRRELTAHRPARVAGLPPFTAGAVGFFAYDIVRQIEELPEVAAREIDVPDGHLMFFDQVLAFDHVRKEILLMVTADLTRWEGTAEEAYAEAVRRLDRLERLLGRPLPAGVPATATGPLALEPRTERAEFLAAVETVRGYIGSGDVFQCVLSQRFDCVPGVAPFAIYRALRVINPSPYMYFLRFGMEGGRTGHIVGSSPELLVRVKGERVEYRPIAGTRARGADEAADRELERELREDAKEIAEHIMLVDLGRNDLGRVSEFGSVSVRELMFVERYSHVMHLVSALEGRLRPELGALDAFRACFPAGTLSGAPKVRAMEIIEELEPVRRGVYGGSVLYADFSGNLDSCIAIRTLFLDGERGYVQAGAGIVADSVAEMEYQECRNKAQAVVRAIERARGL